MSLCRSNHIELKRILVVCTTVKLKHHLVYLNLVGRIEAVVGIDPGVVHITHKRFPRTAHVDIVEATYQLGSLTHVRRDHHVLTGCRVLAVDDAVGVVHIVVGVAHQHSAALYREFQRVVGVEPHRVQQSVVVLSA